jgi:hypothetical protein
LSTSFHYHSLHSHLAFTFVHFFSLSFTFFHFYSPSFTFFHFLHLLSFTFTHILSLFAFTFVLVTVAFYFSLLSLSFTFGIHLLSLSLTFIPFSLTQFHSLLCSLSFTFFHFLSHIDISVPSWFQVIIIRNLQTLDRQPEGIFQVPTGQCLLGMFSRIMMSDTSTAHYTVTAAQQAAYSLRVPNTNMPSTNEGTGWRPLYTVTHASSRPAAAAWGCGGGLGGGCCPAAAADLRLQATQHWQVVAA